MMWLKHFGKLLLLLLIHYFLIFWWKQLYHLSIGIFEHLFIILSIQLSLIFALEQVLITRLGHEYALGSLQCVVVLRDGKKDGAGKDHDNLEYAAKITQ